MTKKRQMQLEILKNYFTFEGNIATLNLVYNTFSELVNPNFGDDNTEMLNDKLFSDINSAVSLLPRKYKLNLRIVIKDFEDYEKEECRRIIKQNIYLAAYGTLKRRHRKITGGWSLIGAGAAILVVSYFLRNFDLWFDLINISGTLFVWEGVNMAFLERNLEDRAIRTLAKSINNLSVDGVDGADLPVGSLLDVGKEAAQSLTHPHE